MSEHLQQILRSFGRIKRPAGRPSKRTPQLDDQICRLLSEGWAFKRIARELDLNPDTLMEWRKTSSAFYAITEAAKNRYRKRRGLPDGAPCWEQPLPPA